jgi:hypothetical protein
MRPLGLGCLILALATLGAGRAQEKSPLAPAAYTAPAPRDLSKWPDAPRQFYHSAHTAMTWLRRANKPEGRFRYGFLPALCIPMEGDNYLFQAGATFALARAARYFGDDASTAIARQALLTLLLETMADPHDPRLRYTAAPPQMLNRLASNGALLQAIHELQTPGKDLLEQGAQLAAYLRAQQRTDGSLQAPDANGASPALAEDAWQSAGLALAGIAHSQKHQPAAWKIEMLRKARTHYLEIWQRTKNLPLAVSHTPAYAEAYLSTRAPPFAEAVFALNDWLCTLQYTQAGAVLPQWEGGFPPWENGRAQASAPNIRCAVCAESLAQACLVARAANDLPRYQRYGRALEQCLHYLVGLQYGPSRVQHFDERFRPVVLGAFHAAHEDGDLRLDYTQHPLSALVLYLEQLGERGASR